MHRSSARVLLVDSDGRVLLFHGTDPADPGWTFWYTVGGGVEPGEELTAAAVRELSEETGLDCDPDDLVGPVWVRRVSFRFDGQDYESEEWFFLHRLDPSQWTEQGATVNTAGWTELEHRTISTHRWWWPLELGCATEIVYPAQLGELLPALLSDGWCGRLNEVD